MQGGVGLRKDKDVKKKKEKSWLWNWKLTPRSKSWRGRVVAAD